MEDKLDSLVWLNQIFLWLLALSLIFNALCFRLLHAFLKSFGKGTSFKDLWETNQFEKIISLTDEILNKKPSDEVALFFRAKALYKMEKIEAAVACYDRLKSINPQISQSIKYIGDSENELLPARNNDASQNSH